MPVLRYGQRQNAITNSPIVRSFIRPVLSIIPKPAEAASGGIAALRHGTDGSTGAVVPCGDQGEDGDWLIPTQPVSGSRADVKGKKRAREDNDAGSESKRSAVEYNADAGTRYGEVIRYTSGNVPVELEKC